jgi:hypothetical protein
MYLPQPREEISQGDVFQNVSLFHRVPHVL